MPGKGKPFVNGDPRAGRPQGRQNNATLQIRELCRQLVLDPEYQVRLRERLMNGKAAEMEPLVWQYAFGKPPDRFLDPLSEVLESMVWQDQPSP